MPITLEELQQYLIAEFKSVNDRLEALKPKPKPESVNYTAMDIRDMFNITNPTVIAWERKGYLQPFFIGRSKFYAKDAVDNLLRTREAKRALKHG